VNLLMEAKEMAKAINIGTVSHGTMRSEDLIPDFLYLLKQQKPLHKAHRQLIKEIEANMAKDDYFDSEEASYDLNEGLFEALNDYAPPYFYFGSHPGDGSDYGFWLSEGFESEFDGLKVADLTEVPKKHNGEVLFVNDHGNMSLYKSVNGRLYEVWSIV
jgi:hypothetical protein